MTKKQEQQQQAAGYLRQHPGERLRYEQVAVGVGLSNQAASIALSGLLGNDVLPGLRRVGRGTYQWDPAGSTGGTAGAGVVPGTAP